MLFHTGFLRVEGAGTSGVDLGTDHVTRLTGVRRVEGGVGEGLADEIIARDAFVNLRLEILAGTVLEHILTASVSSW